MLATAWLSMGCHAEHIVEPRPVIRFASSAAFSKPLIREYRSAMPAVDFKAVPGGMEAILRREADVGLVAADSAYVSHLTQIDGKAAPSSADIRAIAILRVAPLHVLVAEHSPIKTIQDLRGRKVRMIGPEGMGSNHLVETILANFGVDPNEVSKEILPVGEALARLENGALDAMFVLAAPDVLSPAIQRGARMLPIEGPAVESIQRDYPFVRVISIPTGTYVNQKAALRTIGIDGLFVCRSDLDERLVYELTRQFFEVVYRRALTSESPPFTALAHAAGTSIPLHDGAALYYRARELLR
jgi:TRAP transporter TAXI family solute receptor